MTENDMPDGAPKFPKAEPSEPMAVSDQAPTGAKDGDVA